MSLNKLLSFGSTCAHKSMYIRHIIYIRRCLLFQPVQLCRRQNLYATIGGLHMCAKNGLSLSFAAHERDRRRHRYLARRLRYGCATA